MIEKDVFKIIIPSLPDHEQDILGKTTQITTQKITQKTTQKGSEKSLEKIVDMKEKPDIADLLNMLVERVGSKLVEKVGRRLVESQIKILLLVSENAKITKKEMAKVIGISSTSIDKNIEKLKSLGVLKRIGPDKGGYWEIVTDED